MRSTYTFASMCMHAHVDVCTHCAHMPSLVFWGAQERPTTTKTISTDARRLRRLRRLLRRRSARLPRLLATTAQNYLPSTPHLLTMRRVCWTHPPLRGGNNQFRGAGVLCVHMGIRVWCVGVCPGCMHACAHACTTAHECKCVHDCAHMCAPLHVKSLLAWHCVC